MSDDDIPWDDDDDNVIQFPGADKTKVVCDVLEKPTSHIMEDIFNIEGGTTMVPYIPRPPTELVEYQPYDVKDKEIEDQLQEVVDLALDAFENTTETARGVEPQFKARNEEVAAQYLNTALAAISKKADMKQQKDKLEKMAKAAAGTTNNIMVTHNDMLRAILGNPKPDAIDGEYTEE